MAIPNNESNVNAKESAKPNTNVSPTLHRMTWLYRFFCWCSGAYIDVLRRYPTEYNRHFGIGTMVFLTGVFAFVSSSNALAAIFQNDEGKMDSWAVYGAGGLWALFIFFLDRYFVSSMRKTDDTQQAWLIATPRFALAIVIGLVIAHPLELRLFKSEIQETLADQKSHAIAQIDSLYTVKIALEERKRDTATTRQYSQEGKRLVGMDSLMVQAARDFGKEIQRLQDSVQAECNGRGITGLKGRGPACQFWESQIKQTTARHEKQLQQWQQEKGNLAASLDKQKPEEESLRRKEVDGINKRIGDLEKERDSRKVAKGSEFSKSVLAQTRALWELMEKQGVSKMVWFITLLFILLEIAPIMVKLMSKSGAYERALRMIELDSQSDAAAARQSYRAGQEKLRAANRKAGRDAEQSDN